MLSSILAALFCFCDLGVIFAEKDAWSESAVDFTVDNARYGFEFASQKRDIVNCLKRGMCKWHGLDVWEARIYYSHDGAKRIEMSLYNRGDDKSGQSVGHEELKKRLSEIASKIEPGFRFGRVDKIKLPMGGYKYTKKWANLDPTVELTWGVNGAKAKEMVAQFIRVTLTPKAEKRPRDILRSSPKGISKNKIKENVTKNSEGDVWIQNIPMVDQGQKGYCSAAVAERVMRYYGHKVDEHEIAQLAGTEARGGTSTHRMVETVRLMGSKYHLAYQQIVSMNGSIGDIQKEIEMYNKAAKSEKEPEIRMADFVSGNIIHVSRIKEAMKPKVIKKMRVKDSRYKKFLSNVVTQVDQGVPVIWGVTIGIFPEPGLPQTMGGHMRLIIGYNKKTKEILYSDTWGAGHELKRMPEDWAFAITHDAFFLRPL